MYKCGDIQVEQHETISFLYFINTKTMKEYNISINPQLNIKYQNNIIQRYNSSKYIQKPTKIGLDNIMASLKQNTNN